MNEKNENLAKIFKCFDKLLEKRLRDSSADDISEDTIRYLFFYACAENGIKIDYITLEKGNVIQVKNEKHPKLDAFIKETDKTSSLAIEFKYHRTENNTKPQRAWAAKLLYDFYRLQTVQNAGKRIAIYVFDESMMNIYNNMKNDWGNFLYELIRNPVEKDFSIDIKSIKSKITNSEFKKRIKSIENCAIKTLYAKDYGKLENKHYFRIFEILQNNYTS